MEQRRLLNFFLAATVLVTGYLTLYSIYGPPPPPPGEGNPDSAAAVADGAPSIGAADATTGDNAANVSAVDEQREQLSARKTSWATLGSMLPSDGYNMLVTFRNRGGAIERLELTERNADGRLKYRRVDVRSGYLGYLALSPTATGAGIRVNVVGRGTPADLAKSQVAGVPDGLRVDDVIVAVGPQAIGSAEDLALLLEGTKPGDELTVEIERAGAANTGATSTEGESSETVGDTSEPADDATVRPTAPQKLSFIVTLSEHPLDLVRLADTAGADQVLGNLNRASCLLTLSRVGNAVLRAGQREIPSLVSLHETAWDVETSEGLDAVRFDLALPAELIQAAGGTGGVELSRSYRLAKGAYHVDMDLEIRNAGSAPQSVSYRLEGPNGITLEGWWYSNKISPNWGGAAARDVVYNSVGDNREMISAYTLLKDAIANPADPDHRIFTAQSNAEQRQVRYMGVDAQYFSVAYVPSEGASTIDQFEQASAIVVANPTLIPEDQERATNVSFFLDSKTENLEPGGSLKQSMRLFAGPKSPDLLAQYGMEETLEYGWFGWVARPLSGLLHLFYMPVGNYAIAIIMLTLLVRGCMFPLSKRAAVHAQKMQELAPELKKIAEKYKDDLEKRMKAQRELQQRVGFNPMSGCLPMFIQLPIFIGLYRALSVDIELRQAALSSKLQWCANLAGPDMLYYWGDWLWGYLSGRGTGWLGPYFNILPIVVVTLFLVQQKMFMPPATDEQTAMTQKAMTFMTLIMALFFFRVPSGLCVYFITSSLWGIVERKAVKKLVPKTPQLNFGAGTIDGSVVSSSETTSKSPTIAERIRDAAGLKKEEPRPVVPPNKRKRPPGPGKKK